MSKERKVEREQGKTLAAQHRGMPRRDVQPQDDLVEKQITQRDASSETSLRMPHERDQSEAMTGGERDLLIEQAFADEESGLQDTSKEPEMLAAYERQKRGN